MINNEMGLPEAQTMLKKICNRWMSLSNQSLTSHMYYTCQYVTLVVFHMNAV